MFYQINKILFIAPLGLSGRVAKASTEAEKGDLSGPMRIYLLMCANVREMKTTIVGGARLKGIAWLNIIIISCENLVHILIERK